MSTDPLPQSAHARTSSQPPSHSQSVRRECRQLGKPFFSSLPSFLSWRSRRRWRRRGSCWADPVTSDRRLYLFVHDGGKKRTAPLFLRRTSRPPLSLNEQLACSIVVLWSLLLLLLSISISIHASTAQGWCCAVLVVWKLISAFTLPTRSKVAESEEEITLPVPSNEAFLKKTFYWLIDLFIL